MNNSRIFLKTICDDEELLSLENKWNELLDNSNSYNIFLTWEWVHLWWKYFKGNKKLQIVTAWDNDNLVGIAPLYIERVVYFGIRSLTHLEFLGSTIACPEYLDFIIAIGREKEVLFTILDKLFFSEIGIKWDVFNLVAIREDSENRKLCSLYCNEKGIKYEEYAVRELPYIELPSKVEDYFMTLSSDKRNRFKRYKRKLEQEYKLTVFEVTDQASVGKYFEKFMDLHQERWIKKEGEGIFSLKNKSFIEFHKNISRLFFDKHWLQLVFLRIDDKLTAAQYNFIYRNKIYYYCVGFDPQWSEHRVGTVLMLCVLENAIKRELKEFDFLRGNETYKLSWTKISRKTFDIAIWKSKKIYNQVLFEKIARKIIRKLIPKQISLKIYQKLFERN